MPLSAPPRLPSATVVESAAWKCKSKRTVPSVGAETLLVVTLDPSNEELIARIGRDTALRSGDRFDIALDAAAIHLFDSATTKAIVQAS